LGSVCRLDDPNVLLTIMLFEFLIVLVKFTEFIWQNIGVWHEIEVLFPKPLLHPDNVETEPILTSDFMALGEMVNLLVFIKAFIEITLAR